MEKANRIREAFESLRFKGVIKTQKEFAQLIDIAPNSLSRAINGNETYLTDNLMSKVDSLIKYYDAPPTEEEITQEIG